MVALPADTPVTSPKALTLAAGEPLIQVPPALPVVVNKMDAFTHTLVGPEMVPALPEGFTVKVKWATEPGLQLLAATV